MSGIDAVRNGQIAPDLVEEFPSLRLAWITAPGRARRSPPAVRQQLRSLSDGHRGAAVVAMRTHAIPQAYRSFFRQIGLDPDVTRIPSEQAATVRLLEGRFKPRGMPSDALLIALLETGVGLWALDAARVDPPSLVLRPTHAGEQFGSGELAQELPPGRLVIADRHATHAIIFGEVAPGHGVSRTTDELVIFSVGVEGVPAIHIEEALWIARDLLDE